MNRNLFHWIGYVAPILVIPYVSVVSAGTVSERFPVLFFAVIVLALTGFICGILWLMFFIEYRGVWFGKEDNCQSLKFDEHDLPVIKETGLHLQKYLKDSVLYSWDMVFRPVQLADGRRVFNVRYDFVSSVSGRFVLFERFPTIELEKWKRYVFCFRICMDSDGGLNFFEFDPSKRWKLSSPADKNVSPLDLHNSEGVTSVLVALLSAYEFNWQVAAIEYHEQSKPYLHVFINTFAEKPENISLGNDTVALSGGKRECISFRLSADLQYAGYLKRLSMLGQLFSS